MRSPFKNPKNNEKGTNQSLHEIIYKKVTAENYQENQDETFEECKRLFKQGASPKKLAELKEVLKARQDEQAIAKHLELSKQGASPEASAKLEKSVGKKREHYNNYIQHFLPALKAKITKSKKLDSKKQAAIVQTILDITNRSSDKDHSSSTIQNQNDRENNQTDRQGNAMEPFNKQSFSSEVAISTSSDMTPQEKDSVGKGVSGKGISGTYNPLRSSGYYSASTTPTLKQLQASEEKVSIAQSQLNGSFSQSCGDLENKNPSTIADAVEVPRSANTSKLSNDNGSDSGVSSREESLESPISSRRSSMSSILSSAGENNDPQKEDTGNQMQPEQTAEEEPQVSSQCVTLGSREKESMDTNSQTTQMTGSQAKDSMQPEEKKDKKNVITTAQKLPVNEKKGEVKQPNNRNLHVAFVAGCALSTIGCIVAGAMTSGLIGAGLLAMAAVFAIAAVAELHSNFLSSKLISINVSPLVDDKELTACSQR